MRAGLSIMVMRALGVAMVVAGAATVARADVVGPEPEVCPPGSRPSTCHAGPHCRLVQCGSNTDCNAPETCQELQLCRDSVICAGLIDPNEDLEKHRVQTVEGTCSDGDKCPRGTCETVTACAAPAPSPATPDASDGRDPDDASDGRDPDDAVRGDDASGDPPEPSADNVDAADPPAVETTSACSVTLAGPDRGASAVTLLLFLGAGLWVARRFGDILVGTALRPGTWRLHARSCSRAGRRVRGGWIPGSGSRIGAGVPGRIE